MGTPNPGQYQPYQQSQPPPQQYAPPPAYPQPQGYPPQGYGAPGGYQQPLGDPPGTYMGHPLATWGSRLGAILLDGLIVGVPTGILAFIVTFIATLALSTTDPVTGATVPSAAASLLTLLIYLAGLGAHVYNLGILQGRTGQSWGKRIVNLRVVRMSDGQPLGPGMGVVRVICHWFIDSILLIGYLFPLWDTHRQTFADKICSSLVLPAQPHR